MKLYLMEDLESGAVKYYKEKKTMCDVENLTGRLVTYVINQKRNMHKGYTFRRLDVDSYDGYKIEDHISDKITKDTEIIEHDHNRILVIGDLHTPFNLRGYLDFCKDTYEKYDCNMVVFTGDLIDNHYSSYHETNPGGYNADDEFDLAKEQIQLYYDLFPNAMCCIGNHDNIILRKFQTAGLSRNWVKDFKTALEVPNWSFKRSFIIDDIFFYHGLGRKPKMKARDEGMSAVSGHHHSDSYIIHYNNRKGENWFAMQIGTGIDQDKYAFDYTKEGKTAQVNVGVIIDGVGIIEQYDFDKYGN